MANGTPVPEKTPETAATGVAKRLPYDPIFNPSGSVGTVATTSPDIYYHPDNEEGDFKPAAGS